MASEFYRPTASCLPASPSNGVPTTRSSKPSTKLCKCTVIDSALRCLIFRESLPKSVCTAEERR
ncbi:hypothetical protein K443DRAFT_686792 [Laccaria amethystina LaAM-08-1]|uniref:Uncharacterized protein n=1 Tax=Laccaria amethystina LaAM-08-1 TaxID=1095629 RepID=A0A0C9X1F2_9AGAR|nr:hypothetical protein K443DRAFT_686792 [Laccaria amethystina LaAM-08-1]